MILPLLPSFSLKGKRALVTGASSGIGQACAAAMAQSGAKVICAARGIDLLDKTVSALNSNGYDAEALVLDQTDLFALEIAISNLSVGTPGTETSTGFSKPR